MGEFVKKSQFYKPIWCRVNKLNGKSVKFILINKIIISVKLFVDPENLLLFLISVATCVLK